MARKNSYPKKLLADWAKARATEHHRALRISGEAHKPTLGYRIAKRLIFSKIHAALGLDRATVQVCLKRSQKKKAKYRNCFSTHEGRHLK